MSTIHASSPTLFNGSSPHPLPITPLSHLPITPITNTYPSRSRRYSSTLRSSSPRIGKDALMGGDNGLKQKKTRKKGWKGWALMVEDDDGNLVEVVPEPEVERSVVSPLTPGEMTPLPSRGWSGNSLATGRLTFRLFLEGSTVGLLNGSGTARSSSPAGTIQAHHCESSSLLRWVVKGLGVSETCRKYLDMAHRTCFTSPRSLA
jgi:hypothetical protein